MSLARALLPFLPLALLLAPADEVRLSGGGLLRGTIVKETPREVFVDVGPTIVALPRDAIAGIVRADASGDGPGPDRGPADAAPGELWVESERVPSSVRENVERVGPGVVLVRVPGALGSGFVVNRGGHVLTNAHVVQGERNVEVTFFDRAEKGYEKTSVDDVRIVAVNPTWDLALLQIPDEDLEGLELVPIPFGRFDEITVGEPVFAVGNPLGLERSVSEGIVSTKSRAHDGMLYVQTTAPINPGNSGGPLFDLRGRMIGVTTWGYLLTEGLNFAIPVSTVKAFLENREAFAYDESNPNSGYRYPRPPRKGGGEDG